MRFNVLLERPLAMITKISKLAAKKFSVFYTLWFILQKCWVYGNTAVRSKNFLGLFNLWLILGLIGI